MLDREIVMQIGIKVLEVKSWEAYPKEHTVRQAQLNESVTAILSFTDRDSYLEWAREWAFQYSLLSREIRAAKAVLRKKGALSWYAKKEEIGEHWKLYLIVKGMLELRRASKIESARQREERLVK